MYYTSFIDGPQEKQIKSGPETPSKIFVETILALIWNNTLMFSPLFQIVINDSASHERLTVASTKVFLGLELSLD